MNIKQIALILTSITYITTHSTEAREAHLHHTNQTQTLLQALPSLECMCNIIDVSPIAYKGTPHQDACATLKKYTPQNIAHAIVHGSPEEQNEQNIAIASALETLNRFLPKGQSSCNKGHIIEIERLIIQAVDSQKMQLNNNIDQKRKEFINNSLKKNLKS